MGVAFPLSSFAVRKENVHHHQASGFINPAEDSTLEQRWMRSFGHMYLSTRV